MYAKATRIGAWVMVVAGVGVALTRRHLRARS